ncbi:hypothetical protein BDP27DRAFT_1414953 [Rhodocollybia butyracea]|uniref:Uncharacterized protein n=1 Tax=Rhodocollybia butyracea TaxID=206335 RepID=A0A9P5UE25_9AGAR|nr:hypothetical protein BDP27DRAFT_1414953 [Rhodocollybia butyracea]
MDFYCDNSPPPAYSEQNYDQKLAQLSLTITEEPDLEDEYDETEAASSRAQRAGYAHQNSPTHTNAQTSNADRRGVRRLPAPPGQGPVDVKALRVHKKSASHSYGSSYQQSPKPHPKWYGDLDPVDPYSTKKSSHTNARDRPISPPPPFPSPTSPRPANYSSPPQQHRSSAHQPSSPPSPFPPRTPASSHTRSVSQLNFDTSVAYRRPEFPPVNVSPNSGSYNPNSLYNSAVSSHISPSVPMHL